jgi:hypothetical protein
LSVNLPEIEPTIRCEGRTQLKQRHSASQQHLGAAPIAVACLICLCVAGCGGRGNDAAATMPATPAQAASQLDRAFSGSDAGVRAQATAATEALRSGDYEKAVVSLQLVRETQNISLDQGLAVHGSIVALESQLINAMAAGDEKARQAYSLLKAMKRK